MQCMCEGCRGWNELGNLRDSWLRMKVIVYRSSGELFLCNIWAGFVPAGQFIVHEFLVKAFLFKG